jgi:hypothetical protein
MSNVVEFLERMGQDAQLRYASGTELEQAMTQARIEPAVRAALLADDPRRLEALLGAASNVCCAIQAPEEEDEPAEDDVPAEDDDEGSEDNGKPKGRRPGAAN